MNTEFGMKELYEVLIKATQPITINDKTFEEGETIAAFDKIQIANFSENKTFTTANGGYLDKTRVWWETTKDLKIGFGQGIFSKVQFALLMNTKVAKIEQNESVYVPQREHVESSEIGEVEFKYVPCQPLFIYDEATGARITNYTIVSNKKINIGTAYKKVLLDYYWSYVSGGSIANIGNNLANGTFTLTGKSRVKDDITGQTRTALITIPKLKLTSKLSIALGENANPVSGRFDATAHPVGPRGREYVMEIFFLNDDIDSDI